MRWHWEGTGGRHRQVGESFNADNSLPRRIEAWGDEKAGHCANERPGETGLRRAGEVVALEGEKAGRCADADVNATRPVPSLCRCTSTPQFVPHVHTTGFLTDHALVKRAHAKLQFNSTRRACEVETCLCISAPLAHPCMRPRFTNHRLSINRSRACHGSSGEALCFLEVDMFYGNFNFRSWASDPFLNSSCFHLS